MDRDSIEIGKRIRSIREKKGMTSEQFAETLIPPASKGTVSKWENGRYIPNNKRLVTIADLGGISVKELLYGDPKGYLDSLLWNSKLLDDFGSTTFDRFYDNLKKSVSNEEDLYLSEEEAVKYYKRFNEQNKLNEHGDSLGSAIYLASENKDNPHLVEMYLTTANNDYESIFGKTIEDANLDHNNKSKK